VLHFGGSGAPRPRHQPPLPKPLIDPALINDRAAGPFAANILVSLSSSHFRAKNRSINRRRREFQDRAFLTRLGLHRQLTRLMVTIRSCWWCFPFLVFLVVLLTAAAAALAGACLIGCPFWAAFFCDGLLGVFGGPFLEPWVGVL
jgi:hypothetical protein